MGRGTGTVAVTQYVKTCQRCFTAGAEKRSACSCCGVAIVSVAALGKYLGDLMGHCELAVYSELCYMYDTLAYDKESIINAEWCDLIARDLSRGQ